MSHIVELHLHLDGSLRPETVWELAKEQGVELPAKSAEEVKYMMEVPEDCKTLEEYLERFDLPLLVLQKADAIERVTFELVEDLAKEGVEYAELRFAPQFSIKDGLTQDEVVEAAIRGAERGMKMYPQIRVGLILCCMRGANNEELNMQTVETAKKYLGDVVCAVDIAGAEGLFPTENFAPVFAKVREYGVPMTLHAGEAAGPDSMKTALSFGTKRIGHGVAAINDPGFHQFYFFWLYVDHHVRSFDLEFAGVGDVGGYHSGFFASNHLILVIEGFQLFILYAAILKKALHLGLGKNYRVWRILLGFDDLVQFLMDSNDCVILAVIPQGFLYQHIERITLSASGKWSGTAEHLVHKNIVKLFCILGIIE